MCSMRVWLSDLRGARTQHDVARAVGITQNYYSMIETGRRTPRVALAMRLGEVLGFEWQQLFDEQRSGDRRTAMRA